MVYRECIQTECLVTLLGGDYAIESAREEVKFVVLNTHTQGGR